MIVNNDFIYDVKMWVSCIENGEIITNEVMNDKVDGVNPDNSISNIGSRHSSKMSTCNSVSSARVIAESNKAALLTRMAALTESYALEVQKQMIKMKKEQLKLKAILENSTAKLVILQASESHSVSKCLSCYKVSLGKASATILNPMAEEFELVGCRKTANQEPAVDPALTSSVPYQEIRQQPWQECVYSKKAKFPACTRRHISSTS